MPEIKSTTTKNHSIELVRIIACLLVIMAHSQISIIDNNTIVNGRLAISTILADDVPLFLLVTGLFFFGRIKSDTDIISTFPYKAKAFFSRVYIPTIVYILINILYRYYNSPTPIDSILDADWDYLGRFVFRLLPGDHLWYICTYMSFIFFFPMLAFVCQDNPQKNKLRRTLLAIAIGGAVICDIQYFFKLNVIDIDKFLWGYCTIFLILGYELSLFIRKFENKRSKLFTIGVAVYLLGFLIKFGLQTYMFDKYGLDYANNRFRWLQCTPCFITAIGMFMTVYALGTWIKVKSVIANIINYVGSCTFAIYLFHFMVIRETVDLRNTLFWKLGAATTFLNALAYYVTYALAIFGATLIVAIIFKYVVEKPAEKLFKKEMPARRQA